MPDVDATVTNPENSGRTSPETPAQQASTTPAPTGAEFTMPEKFVGKSREEMAKSYVELERRATEAEQTKQQYAQFVNAVDNYFVVDKDSGKIDFNRDLLRKMAVAEGWAPDNGQTDNAHTQTVKSQNPNNSPEDDVISLNDNPREFVAKTIRDELGPIKEELMSLARNFHGDRHEAWVGELQTKYPDFDNYRPGMMEWLNRTGAKVSNKQDLEDAYKAVKAIKGGFVDAQQYKQHIGQLQQTLQNINPSAGRPPIDENTASVEQLLGMDKQNTEATSKISALFGKNRLAPE